MSTFSLKTRAKIVAIMEHNRTISGRRDPISGQTVTEHINLGWFIHLEFGGGTYAFGYGHEKPTGIAVGDVVNAGIWN